MYFRRLIPFNSIPPCIFLWHFIWNEAVFVSSGSSAHCACWRGGGILPRSAGSRPGVCSTLEHRSGPVVGFRGVLRNLRNKMRWGWGEVWQKKLCEDFYLIPFFRYFSLSLSLFSSFSPSFLPFPLLGGAEGWMRLSPRKKVVISFWCFTFLVN